MDFVLTMGTAATAAGLLVALFKMAFPAAGSAAVVAVAVLAGVGLSLLTTLATAPALNRQALATSVVAGIFAAGTAVGLHASNKSADELRDPIQQMKRERGE